MSLAVIVQALREFAAEVEKRYEAFDVYGPEGLAVTLVEIRDCRAGLAEFYDRVEKDLLSIMGDKSVTVEGVGLVEAKKKTTYRKWDNDALWRVVVARALDERIVNTATGEYERESDTVARVLAECARPSWRLTPLRSRGIQPDEFCEVEEDGRSIKLPARAL